ncbi:MAG: hypothetical protein QME75_03070 [Deltaproteobacteria bacterium]|nr:hypothetical protein [Deltaproteobacteria bacterium]
MRHFVLSVCGLLLLAGTGALAWAQFDPPDSAGHYQESIKRQKLGPALGVDQGTVNRLLDIDHKYKPLKEQAKRDAISAYQDLQQVMRNPSPPENQVRAILDKMIRNRRETLNLQQRQLEEEMAVLTPVQQARYLMFLMSLRKQMAQEAMNLRSRQEAKPIAPPRELPVVRPSR